METDLITPINGLKQIAEDIVKQVTTPGKDYWNDDNVRAAILVQSTQINGLQDTLLTWMDTDDNCNADTSLEDSKKILEAIKSLDAYIIFYMFNEPLFTRLSQALMQMDTNITTGEPLALEAEITTLITEATNLAKTYLASKNTSDADNAASPIEQGKRVKITKTNYKNLETKIDEIIVKIQTYESLNTASSKEYIKSINDGSLVIDGAKLNDGDNLPLYNMLKKSLDPKSIENDKLGIFVKFMIAILAIKSNSLFKGFFSSGSKPYDNFIDMLKGLNQEKISQYLTTYDARSTMMQVYTDQKDLKATTPPFNDNFPFKYSNIQKISDEVDLNVLSVVIEYAAQSITMNQKENMIIAWCKCVIIDLFGLTKNKKLKETFSGGRGTKNKRRITNYTRKNLL